ncbi:glycosyltransferase [Romboutsia sedimentorum]|uniref:glycosyltransferase n=1 Tax=Romboutsia sedimentorum TaxID=1368474 RepID=UPI0024DE319B|nr:glycosyltransferase [Romboutsia sedimentorum]MDK2585828.1 glycosyltransferase [Romboutsia sedimentorum]
MNKPLVSIIIPVYNGANFLNEAIDSALNQTYDNIEIIVVNDGSNDNGATEEIALSYKEKIRYFRKSNGGVATALNLGIEKMKGEYFSWLSHDDLYYPDKIEYQINALMEQGNRGVIVYSDFDVMQQETGIITSNMIGNEYQTSVLTNSVFPTIQGILNFCTLLIHKSHFKRVGLFDESLVTTQDYELSFRMLRNQNTIYINKSLICSRVHGEQGSQTIKSHHKEREELYFKILNELNECEMCSMFGSSYNFYHRMLTFFQANNMKNSSDYTNAKLKNYEMPEDTIYKIKELQEEINKLSNGKAKRICIFGTGQWGKRLHYELKSKLISVQYFSDNNKEKWGESFHDTACISPKDLEKQKEDTLVIVAIRTSEEILEQLKKLEFPYVTTKQDISSLLFKVPPLKWLTVLDNTFSIDNMDENDRYLIDNFNRIIFDICKFYQNRV